MSRHPQPNKAKKSPDSTAQPSPISEPETSSSTDIFPSLKRPRSRKRGFAVVLTQEESLGQVWSDIYQIAPRLTRHLKGILSGMEQPREKPVDENHAKVLIQQSRERAAANQMVMEISDMILPAVFKIPVKERAAWKDYSLEDKKKMVAERLMKLGLVTEKGGKGESPEQKGGPETPSGHAPASSGRPDGTPRGDRGGREALSVGAVRADAGAGEVPQEPVAGEAVHWREPSGEDHGGNDRSDLVHDGPPPLSDSFIAE